MWVLMQWAYNSHSGLHSKEIEKKSKKFGEEFKRQEKGSILTYFQTIFPHFNPPVGRGKMTAGLRNKIDAKKPDSRKNQAFLELLARFELATSSLPRMRSTYWATAAKHMPRISGHMWRPRRDLNPRPPAWQAGVLTDWTTRPRLGYNTKCIAFCQ